MKITKQLLIIIAIMASLTTKNSFADYASDLKAETEAREAKKAKEAILMQQKDRSMLEQMVNKPAQVYKTKSGKEEDGKLKALKQEFKAKFKELKMEYKNKKRKLKKEYENKLNQEKVQKQKSSEKNNLNSNRDELMEAARVGNINKTIKLLDAGISPIFWKYSHSFQDKNGKDVYVYISPLFEAIRMDNSKMVNLLINKANGILEIGHPRVLLYEREIWNNGKVTKEPPAGEYLTKDEKDRFSSTQYRSYSAMNIAVANGSANVVELLYEKTKDLSPITFDLAFGQPIQYINLTDTAKLFNWLQILDFIQRKGDTGLTNLPLNNETRNLITNEILTVNPEEEEEAFEEVEEEDYERPVMSTGYYAK